VVHGTGEPRYEELWHGLAQAWPDRIAVQVGYDERVARLAYAGSDVWLMPSLFEPCGLNQMYCQRYGTLPVVRATGGLVDTVDSFDPASGVGTGFSFRAYDPAALLSTLQLALQVYENRAAWRRMQQAAMHKDFSWDVAARRYANVYRAARGQAAGRV
jgi:starch synthase